MKSATKFRTAVLGLFTLVALLFPVAVATANGPYFFSSEGCDGLGSTLALNPSGVSSQTQANVSGSQSPCNWTFVSGNYQDTGGQWYYGYGPGWVQSGSVQDNYSNAQAANYVGHSECNPGGECTSAIYTWTSYPP